MNILTVIAALLVVLAAGQLAALVAITFGHAIPRAPKVFRLVLTPAMLTLVAANLSVAWAVLTGEDVLFGVSLRGILAAYFGAAAVTWWTLDAYAVYHYFRSQHARERAMRGIEEKMDAAQEQATERHVEYTDAHLTLLHEAKAAAERAASLAEAEHDKLDRIERMLKGKEPPR